MPKYLYHYAPPNNTIERDGLLSTALQHGIDPQDKEGSGWRKHKSRAKSHGYPATREGVLRWLDASLPDFRRSYSVSALSEPIPDSDEGLHHGLAELRDHSVVVRIQPAAEPLAAGVSRRSWPANTETADTPGIQSTTDACTGTSWQTSSGKCRRLPLRG